MRGEEEGPTGLYGLRNKRRRGRVEESHEPGPLDKLMAAAEKASKIIVFSGSGLSATSGMSTFSTKGGLYERAQKKFKLSDGKMLFTYSFFDRRRLEAQAFFADIYLEATRAQPAPGHYALSALLDAGRLHRHYTLNIDGLAGMVGMDSWDPDANPGGVTVEMHGNVRLLVCVECGCTAPLTPALARQLKAQQRVPCARCNHEAMRFKVMMYEDAESEAITPEEVMDLMEEDVKACDLILWVGISFQQSASTVYFRNVRRWLQEAGRHESVLQAVINPSDEALWNLMTACSNQADLNVVEVLAESDDILPQLADRLSRLRRPSPSKSSPAGSQQQQQQLKRQASGQPPHAAPPPPPGVPRALLASVAAMAQPQQAQPQQQQQQQEEPGSADALVQPEIKREAGSDQQTSAADILQGAPAASAAAQPPQQQRGQQQQQQTQPPPVQQQQPPGNAPQQAGEGQPSPPLAAPPAGTPPDGSLPSSPALAAGVWAASCRSQDAGAAAVEAGVVEAARIAAAAGCMPPGGGLGAVAQ